MASQPLFATGLLLEAVIATLELVLEYAGSRCLTLFAIPQVPLTIILYSLFGSVAAKTEDHAVVIALVEAVPTCVHVLVELVVDKATSAPTQTSFFSVTGVIVAESSLLKSLSFPSAVTALTL